MSELLKINVSQHTEKKNGLTYLSWAWAWAEVLKIDPDAQWHVVEYPDAKGCALPCMFLPDGSATVKTTVTIKGNMKECLLPVMDHRNKAIKNPDAFAINTATMRCMTKCIGMHGLGLYIYAGEDLPEAEDSLVPVLEASIKAVKDTKSGKPMDGAGDGLSDDRKAELDELALYLVDLKNEGRSLEAAHAYYALPDNDEKLYVWRCLGAESKLRAEIKANSPHKVSATA